VETGTADRRASQAARSHARRRRVRNLDSARTYRCPPGPYERACQVAWYLKRAKPKSKVLILDGNEDVVSKKGLFMKAWGEDYKGIVEYRPNYVLTGVDANTMTMKFETADDVKADVINVIPPQRRARSPAQAA
jgi:NADPH-dependent 2,4-dienoyl-CoA reductase/sulfur reductase-like enzyme